MTTHRPTRITSLANDKVKAIRALEMRKERRATGLFVAEGASLLVTARDAGFAPVTLVRREGEPESETVRSLLDWAAASGTDILEVSEPVLAKLASKDNPQSLIGVFRQRWTDPPPAATVPESATWVALEEVRDPGNLGTIVRTVDAAGASGVILVGQCCDPYAHEAVRASMGSIFAVPLVKQTREAFLVWRRDWPGDVIGLHLAAREDIRHATYSGPQLLVMGSEGPGLTEPLTQACTRLAKIPMAGTLDSLNLAVATALSLYEIRRDRLKV